MTLKKIIYLIIIFLSIIISCNNNNNNGLLLDDDLLLYDKIVGHWKNDLYEIIFYYNKSFEDRMYEYDSNSKSIKLKMTKFGNYTITDHILKLQTARWEISDTNIVNNGGTIIPLETEIEIIGNKLNRKMVQVYDLVEGNGTEIWGKWKCIRWIYNKTGRYIHKTYEGRQELYYNFYSDSAKVTYGWRYLDDPSWTDGEFRTEFNYSPPLLDIFGPAEYNLHVVFKNKRMYWYYSWESNSLYKN